MRKIPWPIWLILFLVALIVVCCIRMVYLENKLHTADNFIEAMNDTLKIEKDKNGAQTASITAFQTNNVNQLLELKSKDSSILHLQETVSQYKGILKQPGSSATHAATSTVFVASTETTASPKDTIRGKDSLLYIYPEYKGKFNLDGWVVGTTKATKDSTHIDFTIKDQLDLVIGYEKGKPVTKLKTLNPYVTTTELRSIIIAPPPQKRLGLGGTIGYGATIINGTVKTGISGSIGITYNLILIK